MILVLLIAGCVLFGGGVLVGSLVKYEYLSRLYEVARKDKEYYEQKYNDAAQADPEGWWRRGDSPPY